MGFFLSLFFDLSCVQHFLMWVLFFHIHIKRLFSKKFPQRTYPRYIFGFNGYSFLMTLALACCSISFCSAFSSASSYSHPCLPFCSVFAFWAVLLQLSFASAVEFRIVLTGNFFWCYKRLPFFIKSKAIQQNVTSVILYGFVECWKITGFFNQIK